MTFGTLNLIKNQFDILVKTLCQSEFKENIQKKVVFLYLNTSFTSVGGVVLQKGDIIM